MIVIESLYCFDIFLTFLKQQHLLQYNALTCKKLEISYFIKVNTVIRYFGFVLIDEDRVARWFIKLLNPIMRWNFVRI